MVYLESPTLLQLLRSRAEHTPNRRAYTFLGATSTDETHVTYGELDRRARSIGAALQQSAAKGERAVLLYPPGVDFIAGLFGTLYAGLVAVPAYPPDPTRLARTLPRLRAIIQDSQATVVLTTSFIRSMAGFLQQQAPDLAALTWLATDAVPDGVEHTWKHPAVEPSTLALLQYTSGSTGVPKGVMLSHANLIENLALAKACFHVGTDSVCVSWLPVYHDMGLMGMALTPMYARASAVLMSPLDFLKQPSRWLEAVSRFRGTITGGPNFGFDLCVKKISPEVLQRLNLSSLELAFCGAEPINPQTLERFARTFEPVGFRRNVFLPCYGLAEATLLVACKRYGSEPVVRPVDATGLEEGRGIPAAPDQPRARVLVSSGRMEESPGHEVVIVTPDSMARCASGQIGEIWVQGPSVAQGYWRRDEETEQTFRACLAATGEGPYLRTGDLAFEQDGELFIVGRLKDLIIIRGRNHYPQDIEATVFASHESLRVGCTAAFSIEVEGEERLVVVQEVDTRQAVDLDEVVRAIRQAVAETHEVQPHAVVLLSPGAIPKTTSGKIQRRACKSAFRDDTLETLTVWRAPIAAPPEAPVQADTRADTRADKDKIARPTSSREYALHQWLVNALAAVSGAPAPSIDPAQPFTHYGIDSSTAVRLAGDLENELGRKLPATLLWDHPTINALARYLAADAPPAAAAAGSPLAALEEPIAIIGMGCRFPKAGGLDAFWKLLEDGTDAIEEVPAERWDLGAYYDPDPTRPGKMSTRWGGFVEGLERFDRGFFGISPREAACMDPQQRLVLEVAWEALEDAGVPVERLAGTKTGVFVGISSSDYGMLQLSGAELADAYAGTGSALSIAANRLSYAFDLRGPSLAIDTACSSSLVAIHQACRSLRSGESTLAVVGGVNALLSPQVTINFSKAGFMAPDGRCKPFDARANGYVRAEGAGVVVLKPLSRAQADDDTIYALIRGSAVNQDGRSNGLTAPNRLAQEEVLRAAYGDAGISPGQVRYVEAHGTGTALGDPIEAHALGAVLATGRAPGERCAIGSVKSNIGHLESAAGIAGLIKTALSLRNRAFPATLHFEMPNPHLRLSELPLRVQDRLERFDASAGPVFAGVSSFGFGGTNAHVVLETAPAAPEVTRPDPGSRTWLLPLSARSPEALQAKVRQYVELALKDDGSGSGLGKLEATCYTASQRRSHLPHRLALVGRDLAELQAHGRAWLAGSGQPGLTVGRVTPGARPRVVFAFAGQGSQRWGMGRALLVEESVFRDVVQQCDALLRPLMGRSLLDELAVDEAHSRLAQTEIAQPALFALQVGLAALWRSLGIEPDVVVGHSVGEIAAAHVAGALSLPQAIQLVFHRSRLMQRATGQGKMALVELPADEAARLLAGYEDRLSIAAQNSPGATVLSGEPAALAEVLAALERRQVHVRMLPVDYAFHSPQMEPLRAELAAALADLRPGAASIPMISTVTGRPILGPELTASYWGQQLCEPVRFAASIGTLIEEGHGLFLEVGPHPVLAADIAQLLRSRDRSGLVLPSLRRGEDDRSVVLGSLGTLYGQGHEVQWHTLYPTRTAQVALPSYPWQRERCWLGARGASPGDQRPINANANATDQTPAGAEADWLYEVQWHPTALPGPRATSSGVGWLIFADRRGVGAALAAALEASGERVAVVHAGEPEGDAGEGRFWVHPGRPDELRPVLARCFQGEAHAELRVLYLWSIEGDVPDGGDTAALRAALASGCGLVASLVQELAQRPKSQACRLWLMTRGAQAVGDGAPRVAVAQAALWGLGRTLSSEHPELWGGMVDLDPGAETPAAAAQLAQVLGTPGRDDLLAVRGGQAYAARLVRRRELAAPGQLPRLRADATYLVTGGLGGVGPHIADWLVERGARRLILLGRTPMPPRSRWAQAEEGTALAHRVRTVQRLEAMGVSVHVAAVDVADEVALAAYLQQFLDQWPEIRGVVHAAGVLGEQEQPLLQLDPDTLDQVMRPKVVGGWLLHSLLKDQPLDFFVAFSSAAAILGLPGQASYSAANAFLDALAHERRALGLPGLSINWGPWAEAGMAMDPERSQRLARRGVQIMAPDQALRAISPLLAGGVAQAGVMSVQWSVLRPLFETLGERPFFALLEDPAAGPAASTPDDSSLRAALRAELLALDAPDRHRRLEAFVRDEVAGVLGMPPQQLDLAQPLGAMGFDSIMALELRNRVQSRLSLALPIARLIGGPSPSELVALLLELFAAAAAPAPHVTRELPLQRRVSDEPAPLSFAQERFWVLHQLEPLSPAANLAGVLHLAGSLNREVLEQSFTEVIRRHEVLRTTFPQGNGHPVQVVGPVVPVELPVIDLRALPAHEREAEVRRLSVEEPRRPYDLVHGPLLRFTLLLVADDEHILVIAMHHVISDGWSMMNVIVREIGALYTAFLSGQPSPLPELPFQYADYAAWERQELRGAAIDAHSEASPVGVGSDPAGSAGGAGDNAPRGIDDQLAYWRQRLAGAPEALELPTDHPRSHVPSHGGARHPFELPRALTDALQRLCDREGTTLFMTLLAALKVLLARYTGQEDLSVGAPITRRNQHALEDLIGPILNTLVLRTDLSGDPSFREILGRVRDGMLGAYAHQDIPFELLIHVLQPTRSLSRSPLFQVALTMQNNPMPRLALPGLTLTGLEGDSGTGQLELRLEIWDTPEGLRSWWVYSTELFEPATLARMSEHFRTLLEGVVADPTRRVSELAVMPAGERQQVVVGWNDTRAERTEGACIHQLFEAQVVRSPDAPAVAFGEAAWSYRELNARANQIAHHLRGLGVGPEVKVGLCVERSMAQVAGMLGILKAGAAFVPLDPSDPPDRLAYMMRDAAIPVLVTQDALADELPSGGEQLVSLDGDWAQIGRQPQDNPAPRTRAGNLAYVIYTSGSTGTPKGTLLQHEGLCNTALTAVTAHGFGPESRVLQYAAAGFDASICEVFSTLLAGACLCLAPREQLLPDAPLRELLERQRITAVTLTPSVLALLEPTGLPLLQTIISAGEALPPELARRWAPGRTLLNAYGPTEVTVCATITRGAVSPERITIGRPWSNVETYILDGGLRPVPIGVPGELYVAGMGLARGYHGRPDLTAEKFLPHPFSDSPGARIYRTGDRARYLPGGQIEYLGRLDSQVKLRGFRIELGEVEAAMLAHRDVREAVAVVREDAGAPRRLVAYVIPHPDQALDTGALRDALKQRLPDYMVPAVFVVLDALPLTPSGKVDRKALPAPDGARPALAGTFAAPRNELEETVAGIWADVLGLPSVGIHDNFFELGGHSLIATQLASRLREAFHADIPLATLFNAPSVEQLAHAINAILEDKQGLQSPPLVPGERTHRLPLSFAQQRLWFLDQMEPGSPLFNIPVTLEMKGSLREPVLERCFGEIIRRHESLRTSFPSDDLGPFQAIADDHAHSLQVIDLQELADTAREVEVQRLVEKEAVSPFDLSRGPLVRLTLLRLGAQDHVLLLTLHHIVCDGWSVGILIREVAALYEAFSRDEAPALPALPIQYADYAVWQQAWLQADALDSQLAYWKDKLAGMPQALELPTDRPIPAVRSNRGAQEILRMPRDLSEAFQAFCRRETVTPFITLLSAFKLLLHRYSGQTDIVVGTDVAHRNHAQTEGLIGFFVNQLVLRSSLAGDPTFRELLGQVREVALEAYAHQDLPFEELVKAMNPERGLGHAPLIQAKLSYEYDADYELTLPGLVLNSRGRDTGTSKLYLTLSVRETCQGLLCLCEYSTDLFDQATIARMLGHLRVLLEEVVADPARRLSELPLLSAAEQHQLLVGWNATRVERPADACIHHLFEAQVVRSPDAQAVAFGDAQWSYRELNVRANQIAHHLRRLGVGPEVKVGLCLEPSMDFVAGMLGILKAGGAFVPLDPSYPHDRLAFMMRDSAIPVLVTQDALADALPSRGEQLVCLDGDWPQLAGLPQDNPPPRAGAGNLAYVIYTSGSTGTPKGTLLQHQGLCNTALTAVTGHGFGPRSRVLQYAAAGFDASVCEVFSTLLAGACLCLAPRDQLLPDAPLRELLDRQRITAVTLTPSVLAQLDPTGLPLLQTIISAGEACTPELARRWSPGRTLLNAYGPTEVTVCATITQGPVSPEHITIGRPWANVQTFILDASLRPVPIGVPGELYVAGVGLARGYHGRPGLTAEKFLPHPFSDTPGARIYRTGDRARYLADGQIEYLGRLDSQVKLRGFRIELGEIEAALLAHRDVREAVAVVREDASTPCRLVAYLVPHPGQPIDTGALRNALKQRLPDYMVPAVLVMLDALPLTPNGKIDRKALPAPDGARPALAGTFAAPRNETEQRLAEIWSHLLGIDQVGIHDNFFELGGDSIISIQAISRARQVGVHLTPKQLFQHQTIAALAAVATTQRSATDEQELVVGPVPLTPIQHWFFAQELPEPHHYNQAVMLEVREAVDPAMLEQALSHLVRHHDALRLRFVRGDGSWQQTHGDVAHHPLLQCREIASLEEVAAELQAGGDLAGGPLLRAALFDRGPGQSARLLIAAHHLVIDGVSWRILVEDLDTAYGQLQHGQPVALPAKTSSFKTWSERLAAYAQSEKLLVELPHWLADRDLQPLPRDGAGGENTIASEQTVSVSLTPDETRLLLREVPTAYRAHIDDVLLTALAMAFAQWTGDRPLWVDLEGHGREDLFDGVDPSRTVGWFTSVYPVRLELPVAASPGQSLRAVRAAVHRVPGHGIGFGLLRYLCQQPAAQPLRSAPTAEVSFNYLGQAGATTASGTHLFGLSPDPTGATRSRRGNRSHAIAIDGIVLRGAEDSQLQLSWTYSEHLHARATIAALAQNYLAALRALIANRRSLDAARHTPDDFPLARLSQAEIDRAFPPGTCVEDVYPLTPMQQGLLFHTLLEPTASVYVVQSRWRVHSLLNPSAFRAAWEALVAHHPILRTSLHWEGFSEPLQMVQPHVELPWQEHDWRGLAPAEQQARLEAFLAEDFERGFDLSRAPMMRLAVLRLADNVHQIVWTHHHAILDGWSVGLLFKDLFAAYPALASGQPAHLEPGCAYSEYIAWLQRQDLSRAESWWRETLRGFTAPTALPGERATGAAGDDVSTRDQAVQLSAASTAALHAFARQHQLTINTLVQGAWALLLSRYSGEQDVLFGGTVSGRPAELPGVEEMTGLFINSLPVRVRLPRGEHLLPWLQALQLQQAEQHQYDYTPLVRLGGWSEIPRGTALFESLLVFENYPLDASVKELSADLDVQDVHVEEGVTFPLVFTVVPQAELLLRISYHVSRFDDDIIQRLLGQLRTILERMAAHPAQRIDEVSLLSPAEAHQLLVAWNDTRAPFPEDLCAHQLFEQQVARTPDAVAVVAGDTRWTYRELNGRANRLAHHLRQLGVGPDTRVGLCLERSGDLVAGLLGILKAGGAYVPLDPSYPTERLGFMLEDAAIPVLVSQTRIADELPSRGEQLICLDADWPQIARHPEHDPPILTHPENLAYIIYTSGSTGRPKGAMLPHRGLVNYLSWCTRAYRIDEGTGSPVHSSIAFDLTVTSLLAPLMVGKPAILVPVDLMAESLGAALRTADNFSLVKLTPSHLHLISQQLDAGEAAGRTRAFIIGGEALTAETVAFWRQHAPSSRLINEYGPTETVVGCCVHEITPDDATTGAIPIGRPIANTELYILDAELHPVPLGVSGELFIGGVQLGRGYWQRPALTAERFIPHPFSATPGARLYRTGDIARYLPDGRIDCLGRVDHQVKIRGFRIELGEIEAVLGQFPTVAEAVALVREDVPGERRLVAYLVLHPEQALEPDALRAFVKEQLPDYMMPNTFVALDAFPLTPNGKVDRKALPAPDGARPALAKGFTAPRNDIEERLAKIWSRLLGIDQVGVHDDFFELGGDSIISIQVIAQARQVGIHLTPKQLFDHHTIAALAAVAATQRSTMGEQELVVGPVPLTPIQRWFFAQELPEPHHYNQAVMLEVREVVDPAMLEQALSHLVRHHDALRLRFMRGDDGWQQTQTGVEHPVVLQHRDGAGLEEACAELQVGGDLASGSLLRAALFDLGPGQPARLLIAVHHLAIDGMSWRILLDDLETVYRQLQHGKPPTLPPKTSSFKTWSERLTAYARSEELLGELPHWLADRDLQPLPRDGAGGENTLASEQTVSVSLTPDETRLLLREVPTAYRAHIDDVLLTALAMAFAQWTGDRPLWVDLEGHGRADLFGDIDLSRTVGWFTSVYPVRLELPVAAAPGQALRAVRAALSRVSGDGISFGLLRYLSDQPAAQALRSAPPIEVSFNYLGQVSATTPSGSSIFSYSQDATGPTRSPRGSRSHAIVIDGIVLRAAQDSQLQLSWTYSEHLHARATIETLAQNYLAALRALIVNRRSRDAARYTPADFPLARVTQAELDRAFPPGSHVEDLYPLTPMQQLMGRATLMDRTSTVYLVQSYWRIHSPLDLAAFRGAWELVVKHHPAFRTGILSDGFTDLLQAVRPHAQLPWQEHDWRALAPDEQPARIEAFLKDDFERGFDLSRAPLMRVAVQRLADDVHQIAWTHHHAILDGWSMGVLFTDLFSAYQALANRQPVRLEQSPAYSKYIAWLQRQDRVLAEAWWRTALEGVTAPTPLPGDRSPGHAVVDQPASGGQSLCLSAESTASLQAFARRHQLTLNTLVLAAWALVLGAHAGSHDVLFGAISSGRPADLPGVERMVGLFSTSLPVRVHLPREVRLLPWLHALQTQQAELRQYEHIDTAQLQDFTRIPRGTPLFESVLVVENFPLENARASQPEPAAARPAGLDDGTARLLEHMRTASNLDVRDFRATEMRLTFPLMITVLPQPELFLHAAYQTARFEPAAVAQILEHLRSVLEDMAGGSTHPMPRLAKVTATLPPSMINALSDQE
jgi:amino acid adenylation domain-containing protein/non-ribosomal peptide synthase protein (TIGR01720 family)